MRRLLLSLGVLALVALLLHPFCADARIRGGVARAGGGGGSNALRVIAARQTLPNGRDTAAYTNYATRWPVLIATDATALVLSVSGMVQTNSGQLANGNSYTISEMSLESNTGTIVPVTFKSGSSSIVIAATDYDIHSDEIPASAFSLSSFPANATYWIKTKITLSAINLQVPYSPQDNVSDTSNSVVWWYDPAATTVSSTYSAGAFTQTGTAARSVANGFKPIVLGRPVDAAKASFLITGDSIAAGVGDGSSGDVYGRGFAYYAMTKADRSKVIPSLSVAVSGLTTSAYLTTNTFWKAYIPYCRFALDETGTNDINGGTSLATIETNIGSIWSALRTGGIEKIVRTYIIPRTTSTDSFASAANQSYFNYPAFNYYNPTGTASQLNTWLLGQAPATIDYVVDTVSIRDGSDGYKFVSNGTASYSTAEGTHPSNQGHILMATDLRPTILPLGGYSAP